VGALFVITSIILKRFNLKKFFKLKKKKKKKKNGENTAKTKF
jgi:hypothetical protein